MPTLRQLRGTPNILIVGSRSIYLSAKDYREKLKAFLYAQTDATSPVWKGSHDFWITYPTPVLPGHSPNHSWEDNSVGPRPLRGIIEMADIPLRSGLDTTGDLYRTALSEEMSTLLQEVGHHWLVPGDLKVNTRRGEIPVAEVHDLVRALNRGQWPSNLALLGRDNRHWSVYTQTEDSPLDGQSYQREETDREHAVWTERAARHPRVPARFTGNVGSIALPSSYSDLDLGIMGVLKQDDVYTRGNLGGRVHWLEPRFTGPLPYTIGLYLSFGPDDYYLFGFDESYSAIGVRSSKGDFTRINVPTQYYPIGDYGAVLRIIRRGTTYYFQARPDYTYTNTERDGVHHLFEELNFIPNPDPIAGWEHFRTIARWEHAGSPQAIGLIVRKQEHPYLAEGRFFNLELQDTKGQHRWRFKKTPTQVNGKMDYSTTLSEGALIYHRPTGGPIVRTVNHRLYLNTPFSVPSSGTGDGFRHYPHFDIKGRDDRAPRIVTRPASGDFVFGSSVTVSRTIMTPWAGGSIAGKQMVGEARSIVARNIIIPDTIRDKQSPPLDDVYKTAFIVLVDDADKVPDTFIEQLDIVRRYWDATFYTATRHGRRSDSRLRRVAQP